MFRWPELVRVARDAIGSNAELFVDANGAYTANQAIAQQEAQLTQRAKAVAALERRVQELITTVRAEQKRLEAALSAQERIIAYRQSFRWWLRMPWIRVRLWLARSR